jgi:hypothetical protein
MCEPLVVANAARQAQSLGTEQDSEDAGAALLACLAL